MKADRHQLDALEDGELAILVQQGNPDAFQVLSARYSSVLNGRASRYSGAAETEWDDFLQEGLLALYRAAKGYLPGGQAKFSTYAITCINNALHTALKRHLRQQRQKSFLPLEQINLAGADVMQAGETTDFLADQIKTRLSAFERSVLRLYLSGLSYRQIAQVLSTSTKPVDNALQRVRRKLSFPT